LNDFELPIVPLDKGIRCICPPDKEETGVGVQKFVENPAFGRVSAI
jgi:hypothetical protein